MADNKGMLKGKALNDFIDSIKAKPRKLLSTGTVCFNMIMGGGYIEGDMIEVASESGTGKTTALLDMAGKQLQLGRKVAYIDTEGTVKETDDGKVSILKTTNVAPFITPDNWIVLEPTTYTELEYCLKYALDLGFHHIIVDSITKIIPDGLLDRGVEDVTVAEKARIQTTFLEKYSSLCKKAKLTVWFVNHMKTDVQIGFNKRTTIKAGGSKALKYLCDVWIRIEGSEKLTKEDQTFEGLSEKVPFGVKSKIFTEKCRSERGGIKVPFYVIYGVGISNPYLYFDILKSRGYITTAGSWLTLKIPTIPEIKKQGELPVVAAIAKQKDAIHNFIESIGGFKIIHNPDTQQDYI